MSKLLKSILLLAIGAGMGGGLIFINSYHEQQDGLSTKIQHLSRNKRDIGGITAKQKASLAGMDYQLGQGVVVYVNNGRSTLNPKSWTSNHMIYQNLDQLGRNSASNTAFIERRNHADTSLRSDQTVQPSGWHDNYAGNLVYNRGHLIAYSLTGGINPQTGKYVPGTVGDQDNPRNLFTETDFVNQEVQTLYETQVRHAIEQGRKVIYQATPIFRGNELVPRGINLQAISTDGRLDFNVYLFNVEPGIKINYQNGTYIRDSRIVIPVLLGSQDAADNQENNRGQFKFIGTYSKPFATAPRQYVRQW